MGRTLLMDRGPNCNNTAKESKQSINYWTCKYNYTIHYIVICLGLVSFGLRSLFCVMWQTNFYSVYYLFSSKVTCPVLYWPLSKFWLLHALSCLQSMGNYSDRLKSDEISYRNIRLRMMIGFIDGFVEYHAEKEWSAQKETKTITTLSCTVRAECIRMKTVGHVI